MSQQGEENKENSNNVNSERTSDDVDACDSGPRSNAYLNPLYGLHSNPNPSSGLAIKPNINQPNWRFTSNPAVAGGPVLHINGPGRINPRNFRPCRGETVDGVVIRQPGNTGVGRAPDVLRNLNSNEIGRRGSESEDERTSRSVSRRSSGGDSGVANLSEGELIDTDNQDADNAFCCIPPHAILHFFQDIKDKRSGGKKGAKMMKTCPTHQCQWLGFR